MSEIIIKEVASKKEMKKFIEFPIKLYKGNPYFVPPLYGDELKLFGETNPYNNISKTVFYLAYRDGKIVGRLSGILQYQYNEKNNDKTVRFTRFDVIDDLEVSKALFAKLFEWTKEQGMENVRGPLDYNDLGREGLLIEGFDQLSTFEEQYNYSYYKDHLEAIGFEKDVDWLEFKIRPPKNGNSLLKKVGDKALKMNNLHFASQKMSKKEYIARYRDGFFHCLDECYSHLYGTVDIDKKSQDSLVDQFIQIVNIKYLVFIVNEKDEVVAFALCFPSMSEVFQGTDGKLTLGRIIKLLHAVNHPKVIDFGLIGVLPEYQGAGLNAALMSRLMEGLDDGIDHGETNLNLETNTQVLAQWRYFSSENHKRRRSFVYHIK